VTFGGSQLFTFNCQNLKDYVVKTAGKSEDEITELCQSQVTAAAAGFSASEFLPIPSTYGVQAPIQNPADPSDADVDWDSIMLYASGCGGVGTATDPTADNRAPVLLRALDGSKIPVRKLPSAMDIKALEELYPEQLEPPPVLLTDSKNPKNPTFKNFIRKFKIGQGPGSSRGC
jgi:hypothetical protein